MVVTAKLWITSSNKISKQYVYYLLIYLLINLLHSLIHLFDRKHCKSGCWLAGPIIQ